MVPQVDSACSASAARDSSRDCLTIARMQGLMPISICCVRRLDLRMKLSTGGTAVQAKRLCRIVSEAFANECNLGWPSVRLIERTSQSTCRSFVASGMAIGDSRSGVDGALTDRVRARMARPLFAGWQIAAVQAQFSGVAGAKPKFNDSSDSQARHELCRDDRQPALAFRPRGASAQARLSLGASHAACLVQR